MRNGTELKITFQDANKKPIEMAVPLLGFGVAFDKVRTRRRLRRAAGASLRSVSERSGAPYPRPAKAGEVRRRAIASRARGSWSYAVTVS